MKFQDDISNMNKYVHTYIHTYIHTYGQAETKYVPYFFKVGGITTFIYFYTSRGYLKCHRMLMISATPSLGDKGTCRYSDFTFQTFV